MLWFMKKDNFLNKKFYKFFCDYSTRWNDNDIYGHINNIHYYSFFDSAINKYLIEFGELNIENDPVVGYIVNSNCNYVSPIKYPNLITVGIRVNKIGNSSVNYGVAIFKINDNMASAYGEFTHVFVEKSKNKSTEIPEKIKNSLKKILVKNDS